MLMVQSRPLVTGGGTIAWPCIAFKGRAAGAEAGPLSPRASRHGWMILPRRQRRHGQRDWKPQSTELRLSWPVMRALSRLGA